MDPLTLLLLTLVVMRRPNAYTGTWKKEEEIWSLIAGYMGVDTLTAQCRHGCWFQCMISGKYGDEGFLILMSHHASTAEVAASMARQRLLHNAEAGHATGGAKKFLMLAEKILRSSQDIRVLLNVLCLLHDFPLSLPIQDWETKAARAERLFRSIKIKIACLVEKENDFQKLRELFEVCEDPSDNFRSRLLERMRVVASRRSEWFWIMCREHPFSRQFFTAYLFFLCGSSPQSLVELIDCRI